MKSGTGEVHMSPGMAYWSVIQLELVVEHTGVGMVVTPDVSTYAMPLTGIQWNGHPFQWREIHDKCFQTIKALACKYPILRPIDPSKPEPIWLVCDTLLYGVGTLYGQGPEWKTCRPAGFMSKKLTDAQQNYWTFEQETLAIIKALMKWKDKLLGFKFTIVTNHKALGYLKTQCKLSS